MSRHHILIIEDDEDIQQLVSFNLIKAGFHVSCADNGEDGVRLMRTENIDCLLLDVMLPGKNGIEICRQIREDEKWSLPIIMLTAKRDDKEIIEGLESGADDYITKPFSPKILIARVKVALRRSNFDKDSIPQEAEEETICIKDLKIYPGRHEVSVHDQKVEAGNRPGWCDPIRDALLHCGIPVSEHNLAGHDPAGRIPWLRDSERPSAPAAEDSHYP